jgi:hypothetical protein
MSIGFALNFSEAIDEPQFIVAVHHYLEHRETMHVLVSAGFKDGFM